MEMVGIAYCKEGFDLGLESLDRVQNILSSGLRRLAL